MVVTDNQKWRHSARHKFITIQHCTELQRQHDLAKNKLHQNIKKLA